MKALIISDDKNFIDPLEALLKEKNFEIIKYRWLLKALDNIEEIKPDCIVLSASEYPRHWKTLVQFAKSNIGAENTSVLLYSDVPMNDDDAKKAELLGVTAIFNSVNPEDINMLSEKLDSYYHFESAVATTPVEIENIPETNNEDIISVNSLEENVDEENLLDDGEFISVSDISGSNKSDETNKISGTGYFVMNHPVTNSFISGKYFGYDAGKLTIQLDKNSEIPVSSEIKYFSYYSKNESYSCKAIVKDQLTLNENKMLILEIQDQYEIV